MSKTWLRLASGFFLPFCLACGRHAATSGPANLGNLPTATGASWALGTGVVTKNGFAQEGGTSGVKLSGLAFFFGGGSGNRAFCSVGNALKNIYRDVQRTDRLKCYVAAVEASGAFGTDLYNGKPHLFTFQHLDGATVARIVALKNGEGIVTDFALWGAVGGNRQTDFFSFHNADGGITLSEVAISGNASQRTLIAGTVNTGGAWTSAKNLAATSRNDGRDAQGNQWHNQQHTSLFESAGALDLSEYERNQFVPSGGAAIDNDFAATGVVQLLASKTGRVADLALGGGTLKYRQEWNGATNGVQLVAWRGDDGALLTPIASADYFADVSARTLASAPESFDVAFRPDFNESWDFSRGDGGVVLDLASGPPSLAVDLAECRALFDFTDETWTDCHALP